MKIIRSCLALFLVSINAFSQNTWSDHTRLMPDKLRAIPVGLTLWHSPALVVPVKEGDTYFWKHSTSIRAEINELTFVEAGSFIWYDSTGWKPNLKLTTTDFAQNFGCKNGKLPKNRAFVFKKNWRLGKQPYGGDALWYILAKDKKGTIYKGYAVVETEDI